VISRSQLICRVVGRNSAGCIGNGSMPGVRSSYNRRVQDFARSN
jgi:hypothetical protein